jgi:hypothetical protein
MADTAVNRNTVIANVATAFIAGTLLRAWAALSFAPQSERKTRCDIGQFAEKAGNKTDQVAASHRKYHGGFGRDAVGGSGSQDGLD